MRLEIRETLDSSVDITVVGIPEGSQDCDAKFKDVAAPLFKSGDLALKPLETFVVPGPPRTVFIGLAKTADAEAWRRAAATIVRRFPKAKRIAFADGDSRAIAEGATTGSFSADFYKTSNAKTFVETVIVLNEIGRAHV